MMKIVAVVPMKLNNERLPNKNTKRFSNGRPLCSYIFNTLLSIDVINEIYAYCSNKEIIKYLPLGVKYLERSKSLDTNSSTMNDVLNRFVDEIDADIYVLTHTTAPFIKKDTIIECVRKIIEEGYDSAFTVRKVNDFLWKDNVPLNYSLTNIPRTQDLPDIYKETCGVYVFKKSVMKMLNRRIGNNPYMKEVDPYEAIDINELFDFEVADYLSCSMGKEEYES